MNLALILLISSFGHASPCMRYLETGVVASAAVSPTIREDVLHNILYYQALIRQMKINASLKDSKSNTQIITQIEASLKLHQSDPLLHPLDYAASKCVESQLESLSLQEAEQILSRLKNAVTDLGVNP